MLSVIEYNLLALVRFWKSVVIWAVRYTFQNLKSSLPFSNPRGSNYEDGEAIEATQALCACSRYSHFQLPVSTFLTHCHKSTCSTAFCWRNPIFLVKKMTIGNIDCCWFSTASGTFHDGDLLLNQKGLRLISEESESLVRFFSSIDLLSI